MGWDVVQMTKYKKTASLDKNNKRNKKGSWQMIWNAHRLGKTPKGVEKKGIKRASPLTVNQNRYKGFPTVNQNQYKLGMK